MKHQEIIIEATGKPSAQQDPGAAWDRTQTVSPKQQGAARYIKLLLQMLRDKNYKIPTSLKVMLTVAALYTVSPIDVIPDFLLGLGQIDDMAVLGAALTMLIKEIGKYEKTK